MVVRRVESAAVDGIVLPALLGGHPALEFCNTFAGWNGGARHDYLDGYPHLLALARSLGLLDETRAEAAAVAAQADPDGAARLVQAAREVRAAAYAAFTERPGGASWPALVEWCERAQQRLRLLRRGDGADWRLEPAAGVELPLLALASSAAELLTSPERGHVRTCPGTGCGWLFLDQRGRRRWCSMAVCGNRAKARRHAERRRDRGGGRLSA